MTTEEFPVCGPRQAVFDALTSRRFEQSSFSDKHWQRADGVEAHVYGAGSRLRVYVRKWRVKHEVADLPMAEALAVIDAMD